MNAQFKSIITSVLLAAVTAGATWAVNKGFLPAADATTIENDAVGAILAAGAAALAWYKSQQHTPTAQIAAVNDAPNGVKVVAETAPEPKVTAPIAPTPS